MALDVGIRDGRIKKGQLVLMEAFGGGFAAVVHVFVGRVSEVEVRRQSLKYAPGGRPFGSST